MLVGLGKKKPSPLHSAHLPLVRLSLVLWPIFYCIISTDAKTTSSERDHAKWEKKQRVKTKRANEETEKQRQRERTELLKGSMKWI